MIIKTFSRYENKFIITNTQKEEMCKFLSNYMAYDKYCLNDNMYTIYNIYLDTEHYDLIINSLLKPKYKEKMRIRSYTWPLKDSDSVYLEIKKKYFGKTNKRRISCNYAELKNYLLTGVEPSFDDYINKQIFKEIKYIFSKSQLHLRFAIAYDRIAFTSKKYGKMRITFDHNIRSQKIEGNKEKINLLDADKWIMEIKAENNYPLWLVKKLTDLQIYPHSFSKYGEVYKNYKKSGEVKCY